MPAPDHLVPIAPGGWAAWDDVVVRSAGFPVTGVLALSSPEAAAAADALLAGEGERAAFDEAFGRALVSSAHAVFEITADASFREAVTWQNPGAAATLGGILRDGPDAARNERRRRREDIVAKYWQRYCLKNDTVGFYGPMAWGRVADTGQRLTVEVGPEVIRERFAVVERWAVMAVADALANDPALRPQFPWRLPADALLVEDGLARPQQQPVRLAPAERAVVAAAGTGEPAAVVAARLVAEGSLFRREADVLSCAERLVGRGVLHWGLDLPMSVHALDAFRRAVEGFAPGEAGDRARAVATRLADLRDRLTAARGPEAVGALIAELDAYVEEVTGASAHRMGGQTYAGRTTCHVEATRDVAVVVGTDLLRELGEGMGPLLEAARWLTGETARTYEREMRRLFDAVADPGEEADLGELWPAAMGAMFGEHRPIDGVIADFVARWERVFRLAEPRAERGRVWLSTEELAQRVAEEFPPARPGWTEARVHSPDMHLLAPSVDAVNAGDYQIALGEIHIGMPSFDTSFFMLGHPDPDRMVAQTAADFPGGRVLPVFPSDWPRHTSRNGRHFDGGADVHWAWSDGPGADPTRLLPMAGMTLAVGADDRLEVRSPDGRSWPVVEVLAGLVGVHLFDAWKVTGSEGHTPRVTVGRMVLARETWRTDTLSTGLANIAGETERFLACRRLRRELGLPERVFVRVSSEIKPFYVDFTSPLYTKALCTAIRSATTQHGSVGVTLTELLPGPEDAWLSDAQGRRYCSEIRLQVVDPLQPIG